MSSPKAVRHVACGTWLLQHTDTGPSGRIYFIVSAEDPVEQRLCPGCTADLTAALAAGELRGLDDPAPVSPAKAQIDELDTKLETLDALKKLLTPSVGVMLTKISADLRAVAA
jgi:hypothetical protein